MAPNLTFDITSPSISNTFTRILAINVLANVAGRTSRVQVSTHDVDGDRDTPLFIWDTNDGISVEANIRIVEDGAAATLMQALIPSYTQLPNVSMGVDQPSQQVGDNFVFRGDTTGFGAGTVQLVALVYLAFPVERSGLSSRGLPLPSW